MLWLIQIFKTSTQEILIIDMKKNTLLVLVLLISNWHWASEKPAIDDEAVAWLQAYLKVDTINPPGNESRAVDFYAEIFNKEGIEFESAESAPGRGNIWARIEGGDKPPIILLPVSYTHLTLPTILLL